MNKTKIIAEIGCNHMGDIGIAREMIAEAAKSGADFVKLQKRDLYSMKKEVAERPYSGPHSFGSTYGEHRAKLEFDKQQWYELAECADSCDIGFFGTPFDLESLLFLCAEMRAPLLKFGSTQVHDSEMIRYVQTIRHPKLILSSGMCDYEYLRGVCKEISPDVVMQTTSAYPCEETEVNLRVLNQLKSLALDVGLSGHYVSGNGAIEAAAVAMGATWIERHFTLDRSWKGTDQAASLEPDGLRKVVKAVRSVERALGRSTKEVLECEQATLKKIKGQA